MKETDFSKFENKYVITGKIILETPLRIGSQRPKHSTSSAALLMRETGDGFVPFIPGSSLKGVLRSSCERVVNTFGADARIINEIFGSMNAGAKIRVRDCDAVNFNEIEERIHCATKFKDFCQDRKNCGASRCSFPENFYKVKLKDRKLEPDTLLISDEEYIPPSVYFNFCIELDNASDQDLGMVLLGLDEFNYKRAGIGGGISRGYGFMNVKDLKIEKIALDEDNFSVKRNEIGKDDDEIGKDDDEIGKDDVELKFKKEAKKFLNENKSQKKEVEGFEIYKNTVVCEFDVIALSDFKMSGVDESVVKVNGIAIIPGSTIKGFLRHSCYYTPNLKGTPPELLGCKEPKIKWEAYKVAEIFGSTKQRSKILVSDAFFESKKEKTGIEENDKLKCWIVFDNIDEDKNIKKIIDFLGNENTITGKTSSKNDKNRVKFELKQAYKFTAECENFYKDVTAELKK